MIVKMLLDTHIVLWAIADSAKLPEKIINLLESKENEVSYSVASIWEVAIKHKIRPAQMPLPEEVFVGLCQKVGFTQLPIKPEHIFCLKELVRPLDAPKHNDPFDRMLLAQAKYEKLKLVTHDSMFLHYKEDCIMRV